MSVCLRLYLNQCVNCPTNASLAHIGQERNLRINCDHLQQNSFSRLTFNVAVAVTLAVFRKCYCVAPSGAASGLLAGLRILACYA